MSRNSAKFFFFYYSVLLRFSLCFHTEYITENIDYNSTVEYDMNEDYYNEEESCSLSHLVNNFNVSKYLPDDYKPVTSEEEFSRIVPHINESFARVDRIKRWAFMLFNDSDLVTNVKLIGSRISEIFYEIDLPPECMNSFVRIFNGVRNLELWAVKG